MCIRDRDRSAPTARMFSETDAPEWGSQEERGIDMEVETAMAVIAAGSNAVILKHPESIKIISGLMKELV